MEEVRVSFYKIATCGYYERGNHRTPRFGQIDGVLEDLQRWGRGKRLAHTKTFDPADGGNHLPAYLVGVTRHANAWLLTLWNESHSTDGKVTSINGQAAVGTADVSETEVEEGHIPGHATYFWILPQHGLIASIRFQHPTAGVSTMAKYVRSFTARFTSNVVLGDPDDEGQIRINGYRENAASPVEHLTPRFNVEVYVNPGPVVEIIQRSAYIRKLKKKAKLNLDIRPDRSMFQKLLSGVNLAKHRPTQQEAAIQYEVEVDGLEQEEVRQIVAQWYEEDSDDSDYGFVFRGETDVHWLRKQYVRETLELEVDRDNAELVNPQSLLRELQRHQDYLMGLIR